MTAGVTSGKVLVTGAAGHLGRFVVNELAEHGYRVVGLDRVRPDRPLPVATFIEDDLASRDLIESMLPGTAAVVHLAALPTPTAAREDIVYTANVATTAHVLYAAEACKIGRVIVASSQSALGLPYSPTVRAPDRLPVDETHPCRPLDGYGASKVACEALCRVMSARGDMVTFCLRFPVIWAPAQFAAHTAARIGRPQQAAKSNWAYVDGRDAARGVRLALAAPATGNTVLNITSQFAFCDRPIGDLVREWYGMDLPEALREAPDAAIFDWRQAERAIGFRSRYRWTAAGIEDLSVEGGAGGGT